MSELSKYLVDELIKEVENTKDYVVVYSGRFQPFHKGHFLTYSHLVKKFGKNNVFIGTTDVTDKLKSPFNFEEKKVIMSMFGIPKSQIHHIKNPYAPKEILDKYDPETTAFITVVGEKDSSRLGGKYFTPYTSDLTQGYKDKGYVYVSPRLSNISGTDVRNQLGTGTGEERKKHFLKIYPKYDEKIFNLITSKLGTLTEILHIPKEVIEQWVQTRFYDVLNEITISTTGPSTNGGKNVDDGPNFFFGTFDTFDTISKKRAEDIGYTVFKQISSGEFEDYTEYPVYPKGPVKAVTPFPAGVIGHVTATNQKDYYGGEAYDKWYAHVTRSMGLVGYQLVHDMDSMIKNLSTKDLNNLKTTSTHMTENGIPMGYPSKEQLIQKEKELKDLGDKLSDGDDEYYTQVDEDINVPINVGDTVLGGKFKNKKIVVKTIGKNEKGDITINGKPLLKYRIIGESDMSLNEIPMSDLIQIDKYADSQLNPVDVVLTGRHFMDRLVDPRNKKPISAAELTGFFKRLSRKKDEFVGFLKKYGEIVAKDNRTKINIPFMKSANKAIAKTIMRKDDFKTPSPELKFEAQAVSGGKVNKFITGKNLLFKGKKYPEIHFETLSVNNSNGTIRLKIISPKEIFGNEMSLDFRTIRRGAFFKTDTNISERKFDNIHSKEWAIFRINNGQKWYATNYNKIFKSPDEYRADVKYSSHIVPKFTHDEAIKIIKSIIGISEKYGIVNSKGQQKAFDWRIKYPSKYSDVQQLISEFVNLNEGITKEGLAAYYKAICKAEGFTPLPVKFERVGKGGAALTFNSRTMKPMHISFDMGRMMDPEYAVLHELTHQIKLETEKDSYNGKRDQLAKFKKLENRLVEKYMYSKYSDLIWKTKSVNEDLVRHFPNTLGVKREHMPQIQSKDVHDYIEYLRKRGLSVKGSSIPISKVKMTQKDLNVDKVKNLLGVAISNLSKPVIISKDNYILDGHHRVVALYNIDNNYKLSTIKVDTPIKNLLSITKDYPNVSYKSITEGSDIGLLGGGNNSARWTPPGKEKILGVEQLSGYIQKDFPVADDVSITNEKDNWISTSKTAKFNNKVKATRDGDGNLVFENIESNLEKKYGVEADIYEYDDYIELTKVVVPEESRGGGIGTKFMNDLIKYAKSKNKDIFLTPSSDFGGNKNRLIQFYKGFGFKNNKGKYRDFRSKNSMILHISGLNEMMIMEGGTWGHMNHPFDVDISEAKQVGVIYHYTTFENGLKILQSNQLKADHAAYSTNANPIYAVSFTRDKRFHNNHNIGFGVSSFGQTPQVRFTVDGNKLSNKFKVQPYSQQGNFSKDKKGFEAEERVTSNKPFFIPIISLIKSVDILIEYKKPKKNDYDWGAEYGYETYAPISAELIEFVQSKRIPINLVVNKNGDPWPDKDKKTFIQKVLQFVKTGKFTTKESVNELFLNEGGTWGHMNHPFDVDINLTFGHLKDIVHKALNGELELTREKTDGQAISVSWVNGRLVAARNKSHLKNRGENAMDMNTLASKFAGRGGLSDAYNFAMKDLSVAIGKLTDKQKERIFGNGSKFMQIEVIYPDSVNVIPYGQALLVFHGSFEYDIDGNIIGEDQPSGRTLAGMIKQVNHHVQDKYTIQAPPVTKLPKNQELSKLKPKYIKMIADLQKEFGLKDNQGVGDYHYAWWMNFVNKHASSLDEQEKIGLVKRWAFMDKGFRISTISDEKIRTWADKTDKQDHKDIAKENLMKFEKIFLGVGSDVLQFMTSVLTVNPDSAKRQMISKLEKIIDDVKASGDPKKIQKLKLELQRLQDIGGFEKIVPIEGIVFVYNGNTMKLTGAFAPLNQLLGIFF